jgi:hypothetical protein
MAGEELIDGPYGLRATLGATLLSQRTVLVAVHTLAAGARLMDVWRLLEVDRRIQIVFTRPPGALIARGTDEFLAALGGVVVPWSVATQTRFDLAIAASHGQLERLHAPVVTMSHGIGFSKYSVRYEGFGPQAPLEVAGLERAELVHRGRVIPSAVLVPTRRNLDRLCRELPEAAGVGVVAGDPCYDRLAASLPLRDDYRRALGVGDKKLIAVSSTWGSGSLLQRCPDLLSRLAEELPPDDYLLVAIVHPNTWCWHGRRQLTAWYFEAIHRGLIFVPPEEGWRAVLAASDGVIGDHGSVTAYAAAIGIPVLLATFADEDVDLESPLRDVARIAPWHRAGQPVRSLLPEARAAWSTENSATIRARITDVPGQSARIVRRVMYQLLNLPEPVTEPTVCPVPVPAVVPGCAGAGR